MTRAWTSEELNSIERSDELRIATPRNGGSLVPAVPIWVVRAGDEIYVRTWYRRDSGWFGRAVRTGRGRVEVPGVALEVVIEDIGAGPSDVRSAVDTAYTSKYSRYGTSSVQRMVADDAAAATLRLRPSG